MFREKGAEIEIERGARQEGASDREPPRTREREREGACVTSRRLLKEEEMSVKNIYYSDKYYDDTYEYR